MTTQPPLQPGTQYHASRLSDAAHLIVQVLTDTHVLGIDDAGTIAHYPTAKVVLLGDLALLAPLDDATHAASGRLAATSRRVRDFAGALCLTPPANDVPADVPADLAVAIEAVAIKARELPEICPTRLDKAVALAMAGAVTLQGDGHADVRSSDGTRTYHVNGACDCEDYRRGHLICKHRLAARLVRRAHETLARYRADQGQGLLAHDPDPAPLASLPEAPCSVNVRIDIEGYCVQWTLRDTDEARLSTRLRALLAQYPATA